MPGSLVDPNHFRKACSQFATGITIPTVLGSDGKPHGFTANSFTSVSLSPPMVLICVDNQANVIEHFRTASSFGINILEATQQSLSSRFAGRGHDRFRGVDWRPGELGAPLIDGAIAHMVCSVTNVLEVGDHFVFFGKVIFAQFYAGNPLLYFQGRYESLTS